VWRARQRYSHLRQRKPWLTTATRKRPEFNGPHNRQERRDPTDSTREVPIGATTTTKNSLQGNLAGLGNNVYQYGTRDQGDRLTRTTEAIADYVGREYSKEMRLLVKNQEENEPKEPVMPDKEEAKLTFVMKKYETELKQYYFKKERYEEHKAKIFVIVKGQCTLNMKNKVESLQGYDLIEAYNDDFIKLFNGLKELTFKMHKVQYRYWTIC
jgi:hypothetical protein